MGITGFELSFGDIIQTASDNLTDIRSRYNAQTYYPQVEAATLYEKAKHQYPQQLWCAAEDFHIYRCKNIQKTCFHSLDTNTKIKP